MGNAAEVAATDEDGANGFNEVAYRVDVCGEISQRWHGTCWSKKTRKQQENHHEEPHHEDSLLHGVGVIGDNEPE